MSNLCPKTAELVEKLFMVFYAVCNGFDKQFENFTKLDMVKNEWVMAFMDLGFSSYQDIEVGVKKVRIAAHIYIPTIGDFVKLCKKSAESLNLLTKERAYAKAYDLMRNGILPEASEDQLLILNHTIQESGTHFLKTNGLKQTQDVFYRNYDIAINDFINGALKPIPKAIESSEDPEDKWKTLRKYGGILPQYAHLRSRELAMPVVNDLLKKGIFKKVPKC